MVSLNQKIYNNQLKTVDKICLILEKKGIPVNNKRKKVICTLCNQHQEVTAETLWLDVYKIQKISISAIYGNLKLLVKAGVVEKYGCQHTKSTYKVKFFTDDMVSV